MKRNERTSAGVKPTDSGVAATVGGSVDVVMAATQPSLSNPPSSGGSSLSLESSVLETSSLASPPTAPDQPLLRLRGGGASEEDSDDEQETAAKDTCPASRASVRPAGPYDSRDATSEKGETPQPTRTIHSTPPSPSPRAGTAGARNGNSQPTPTTPSRSSSLSGLRPPPSGPQPESARAEVKTNTEERSLSRAASPPMRSLSLSDKKTSTAAASPSASVEARRREAAQLSKAILKGKWSALKAKFLSQAYQGGSHILNAWAEAGVGPVPMDTSVTLIRIQNDGSFSIEREDRNGAPKNQVFLHFPEGHYEPIAALGQGKLTPDGEFSGPIQSVFPATPALSDELQWCMSDPFLASAVCACLHEALAWLSASGRKRAVTLLELLQPEQGEDLIVGYNHAAGECFFKALSFLCPGAWSVSRQKQVLVEAAERSEDVLLRVVRELELAKSLLASYSSRNGAPRPRRNRRPRNSPQYAPVTVTNRFDPLQPRKLTQTFRTTHQMRTMHCHN